MGSGKFGWLCLAMAIVVVGASWAQSAEQSVHYEGRGGAVGNGKRVVLVSGDEEYRSEEALPQLAKILSTEHGFDCTVLFAINPKTERDRSKLSLRTFRVSKRSRKRT